MFWTLIGILVLLWLLGFSFEIAGGIIHLLIVIALILVIFNLLTGRRT
ncbi:lmo0937 family membrane protein [Alkalihalobacterium sp. APHAB7]|nr:lmo0937 family membrane protein [Bacillaceae bacterium]